MSYSYKRIKKLKVAEVFWTKDLKYTVSTEPEETFSEAIEKNQLVWFGKSEDGEECRFLVTEGLEHYGPSIYGYKAYVTADEFRNMEVGC